MKKGGSSAIRPFFIFFMLALQYGLLLMIEPKSLIVKKHCAPRGKSSPSFSLFLTICQPHGVLGEITLHWGGHGAHF
jgi:hypothetical protein